MLNFSLSFGMLVLSLYLLAIGKSFFIPLVISVVVWYLIVTLSREFGRIQIKDKNLPYPATIVLSLVTMGGAVWLFMTLINANIDAVAKAAPHYQAKFLHLVAYLSRIPGFSDLTQVDQIIKSINVPSILSALVGMLTTVAGYTGMILVYVLLLFLESHTFDKKLAALFPAEERFKRIKSTLTDINRDIRTYIVIKTLMSILTGSLSYAVLYIVGVDFAAFWAVLIFLLNFIPTFGAIVGVVFPILITMVQFDGITHLLVVMICLSAIQFVVGNVLEPKYMGQSLNLSPIVIIIALTLWGSIWGVTGMFLCVPITVILNIVLSKFPATRPIAIMLSVDGKVK